jgi:hypothetical protein
MTDRLFDTTPVHFQTLKGVPVDLLDEPEPDGAVDYLRLATGVTRSREFRKFRKAVGPLALAWWVGLLVVTKRDGTFGILAVDDVELSVEAVGSADHADDVAGMLRAADAAGLVWTYETDDAVMVRVRRWSDWQPRTPKERQRLRRARDARDRSGGASSVQVPSGAVTEIRDSSRGSVTGHAAGPPVTRLDSTRQNDPPPARVRASAPVDVREPAREADDPLTLIAAALADLYPDPDLAGRAAQEVWSGAFMRKAKFRHGLTAAAIVHGIRELADHRRRDPAFTPRDVVEYVCARAAKWNPNAPDLTLTTIENGDPRERPTIPSDPAFAQFDG